MPDTDLVLGYDFGASSVKAAMFTPDGAVQAVALCSYPVHFPQSGRDSGRGGGLGDVSAAAVGAGNAADGLLHLYIGTSLLVRRRAADVTRRPAHSRGQRMFCRQ